MSPRIVGLDLSLTQTGVARIEGEWMATGVLKPTSMGHQRIEFLRSQIGMTCLHADLVVVEGPSFGSPSQRQRGHHERAGLWWIVTQMLWDSGRPFAVVTPGQLKKYATGKGTASKPEVLIAVVKRLPAGASISTTDEADAFVLAAMGADHLGCPVVAMPALHRAALSAVTWPEVRFAEVG